MTKNLCVLNKEMLFFDALLDSFCVFEEGFFIGIMYLRQTDLKLVFEYFVFHCSTKLKLSLSMVNGCL